MFRSFIKLGLAGLFILTMLLHHFLLHLVLKKGSRRLGILSRSVSRYCRIVNRIFGVQVDSDLKYEQTREHLVICNHMSYMDILVLSSIYPTLYVTSVEMKETPLLGQICTLAACLFTERRKGKRSITTMKKDIGDIGALLGLGFSTTIYPEGFATNGMKLLPFRYPLFESAMATGKKVLPVAIRYTYLDGEVFSEKNCDNVCWHTDEGFLSHIMRFARLKEIKVKVRVAQSLTPKEFKDRGSLGRTTEKMVSNLYQEMKEEYC